MTKKLNFELVPDGCWHSNLRYVLSPKAWNFISKDVREKANSKCSICGKDTNKLEAHEVWEYDIKKGIQKLKDVVAICKDCHETIHINRTYLKGNYEKAEDHYMKVNDCTYSEMRIDMGKANDFQKKCNEVSEWKLDLTWLKKYIDNQ